MNQPVAARCPRCKAQFVTALPANCSNCLIEHTRIVALEPIPEPKWPKEVNAIRKK